MMWRSMGSLAGAVALVAAGAREAPADDKAEKAACIAAHGGGQEQRLQSHWQAAEKSFKLCARSLCPAVIVTDCVRWYDELRAAMPGVIVAARGPDGGDTIEATLVIDGARVADHLSAMAIEVDPGEHVFRLEHPGWPAVEQKVVLREGDKERRLTLNFAATPGSPKEPGAPPPNGRSSPLLGIVLVSTGVVGAAVGIPFGISAKLQEDSQAGSCGKTGTCDRDTVGGIARDYWIAGIAGGLGAVALGLGIWQLLSRGPETSPVAFSFGGATVSF